MKCNCHTHIVLVHCKLWHITQRQFLELLGDMRKIMVTIINISKMATASAAAAASSLCHAPSIRPQDDAGGVAFVVALKSVLLN